MDDINTALPRGYFFKSHTSLFVCLLVSMALHGLLFIFFPVELFSFSRNTAEQKQQSINIQLQKLLNVIEKPIEAITQEKPENESLAEEKKQEAIKEQKATKETAEKRRGAIERDSPDMPIESMSANQRKTIEFLESIEGMNMEEQEFETFADILERDKNGGKPKSFGSKLKKDKPAISTYRDSSGREVIEYDGKCYEMEDSALLGHAIVNLPKPCPGRKTESEKIGEAVKNFKQLRIEREKRGFAPR